ncbi:hypothetical protein ZHAS_00017129 [Anopheles sinensis]|uniref:Uncharacterized protein n=1 Tax=Anopheles sinensis TaxID=74873 RepID=A0A084WF74_ANOSI|nr:hypothetical protein ZHAS_00017129 [Anopheles sinensis]
MVSPMDGTKPDEGPARGKQPTTTTTTTNNGPRVSEPDRQINRKRWDTITNLSTPPFRASVSQRSAKVELISSALSYLTHRKPKNMLPSLT